MPENALTFIPTQHKHPTPAIDPAAVHLPPNFTVCVLGASRGIGASIAHAYAQAGASTLILAARSASALSDVAAQCTILRPSLRVHCEPCDIASNSSVESLAARIKEQCGRLDVVVVSSGVMGQAASKVTETDPEEWKRCFDVNTVGTYNAAYHLVPLLLRTPGGARAFVAISTFGLWWTTGPPLAASGYLISKLAQLRLVELMAQQYQEEGLLSVGVHPGTVATEMTKALPAEVLRLHADDVELCGAFCVWLTKDAREKLWLSGRWVSATWDTEELTAKRDGILEKDLLKARIALS